MFYFFINCAVYAARQLQSRHIVPFDKYKMAEAAANMYSNFSSKW